MNLRYALPLLLMSLTMTAQAQDAAPAPAAADTFEREMIKALKLSFAAKRGVVVHVGGNPISAVVKAIGPDVIILSNREHATIVVRRERIDAVEAD